VLRILQNVIFLLITVAPVWSQAGSAGVFDYYLLSLSWSPEYCAGPGSKGDSQQCGQGRRFGFVVHGLWPQYERGYPTGCGEPSPVPNEVIQRMLPLMPSARLIEHEWNKHGTCSGLPQAAYFMAVERARAVLSIPQAFEQPLGNVEIRRERVKQSFVAANPDFGQHSFQLACAGRFLREVRVCLTKDLGPRGCGADLKDTCPSEMIVLRPVR
jgi:ribonuclease T2